MASQSEESFLENIIVLKRTKMDKPGVLESGVGVIEPGQVLAMKTATGKLVKYNAAGADGSENPFTIYTGGEDGKQQADSTSEDVDISYFASGTEVDKSKIVGLDPSTDFEGAHKLYLAGIYLEEVRS